MADQAHSGEEHSPSSADARALNKTSKGAGTRRPGLALLLSLSMTQFMVVLDFTINAGH